VGSESLLELLQTAGKSTGKDYTVNLLNSQVVPSYYNDQLPAVRQYRELMAQYRPQPPVEITDSSYQPLPLSFVAFEGFLDAKVLVEVLRKMGPDLDRKHIRKTVESIQGLDLGIEELVSFGPGKHQGLDKVYFTVAEDGRFVRIKDWKRWSK